MVNGVWVVMEPQYFLVARITTGTTLPQPKKSEGNA